MKNVEDIYALSPLQHGLLFHTLYDPGSGVYVEQMSCTLQGELNVSAFERAWQQVVQRHPVLRTAFVWEGLEAPLQVVRQRVRLPWELGDWRGLSASEQEARLAALLQTERTHGFELSKAPLLRLILIRCAEESYYFICSYHHLLLDG